MRRVLAILLFSLLLAEHASAETSVYTFAYDAPPEELVATVMLVAEGQTEVTMTFAGDCTLGGETTGSADRFARIIEREGVAYPFANLLALTDDDDLTLVNLEGVLSNRKLDKVKKQYNFKGEASYTQILLQGGVECVTLANNHALDYGAAGKRDTIAALENAGIAYVDSTYVTVLDKDGVRIGITGSNMRLDRDLFLAQAKALYSVGCQTLVHVMHMGEEYADILTASQQETARFLAENGVTLVVGSHPHVVQGVAILDAATIVYSLGNCVFGGNTDPSDYDAVLLQVKFKYGDGVPAEQTCTLWPIRISGQENRNNYQPVLLSGEDAQRVLDKMQTTSAGFIAPFTLGQGALISGAAAQ